jgi:Domain of unknown function (DUF1929)
MAAERSYPSLAPLGTNDAVIVGGGPTLPEVYQTDGTLRRLSNASGYSARTYPFLTTRPDGRVELLGPPSGMRVRQYHPSATLLPDGRVLTGGGVCASCKTKGYLERNVEYFEPPYLFKKDGSGEYATRPVIDTAPASTVYGQDFKITLAQAATINKVGLVRLGANTHSVDQGQRYVPLNFTGSGTSFTATAPKTRTRRQPATTCSSSPIVLGCRR